jgi:DNA N-6-adenine-methyltransferase (Dam)
MVSPRRNLIRSGNGRLPIKFDPKRFRLNDRALDFTIEEAKRIRDWASLEEAVKQKIEEELKFVRWWKATVRKAGQPKKRILPDTGIILSEPAAKEMTGIGSNQKLRMSIRLKNLDKYHRELVRVSHIAAQLADPDNFRAEGTGNNEWHTPEKYIELARAVLGTIDLDPASSRIAQRTVKAKKYFSIADDGLTKPWRGRVWLNPPYSPKEIAAFVAKLCAEFADGHVTAAIMLTHNYTDSGWFQKAAALAASLCFPGTRIRFEDPDGVPCSPTQGQAFFYFGRDKKTFAKVFGQIGFVVEGTA